MLFWIIQNNKSTIIKIYYKLKLKNTNKYTLSILVTIKTNRKILNYDDILSKNKYIQSK